MLRLHGATKRNILVTETTKPACAGFEAVRRRLQALRTKVSRKFGLGAGERDLVALILALSDKAFKLPGLPSNRLPLLWRRMAWSMGLAFKSLLPIRRNGLAERGNSANG